ncbi:hypothetical protein [Arthrobacter sp.]|uniref:hypothetical protein n=1 Tax=Arthrobacter sp. TaxID=1667 RepID=UPI002810A273|nr:hypothetical protein [Arthrobacter sp.]
MTLRAAGVLLLSCLMGSLPASAEDATSQEHALAVVNTTDGPLSLEVSPYPLKFKDLTPGDSVAWTVTPKLRVGFSGPLSLQIVSAGPLAENDAGAQLTLLRCGQPWIQEQCASGAIRIVDAPLNVIDPERVHDLGFLSAEQGVYIHARFTMPMNLPDHLQDSAATFGLGFNALGDAENVTNAPPTSYPPRTPLADTGAGGLLGLGGLGLLLAVTGIAVRFRKHKGVES